MKSISKLGAFFIGIVITMLGIYVVKKFSLAHNVPVLSTISEGV